MSDQAHDTAVTQSTDVTADQLQLSVDELNHILRIQQAIFTQVASNTDSLTVLAALCQMAEHLLPNSVASIMLQADDGLLNVLVAPSVPQAGVEALQGLKPGPGGGSCGNAVFRNEPVFVRDTKTDPRWHDLRHIAYDFNLCSCWSMPIRDNAGKPQGSFALSSFEHRSPSPFHSRLLEVGAAIANIVLAKQQQELILEQQRSQLVGALEYDSLTGLPNQSKLKIELKDSIAERSLLLINLDNFRFINTAYGPAFGDRFLSQVAALLQQQAGDAQLFRLNADEFALLFPAAVDLEAQVKQLRNYLAANPMDIDEQSFHLTFTAGGCTDRKGVLDQAVQAISKAKAHGKGRFHLYDAVKDEPDQAERMDYIHWNRELHSALREERLQPYFQGIRDNSTGELVAYEALVRLESDGQVFSPFHFLNTARLSGLLPEITRQMIDKGLARIANSDKVISFNITEDDLAQDYLGDYLLEKCQQYQVEPGRVVLEILEGVSSSGKKNHIAQLGAIKAKGFRLAIDDFGTEYSNFERILELDINYLKIDAKYIRNIDTDENSYEIARAIVYFARNAGIKTVAEFVHNEAVQSVVEALGIDFSQGYLFSEPAADIN